MLLQLRWCDEVQNYLYTNEIYRYNNYGLPNMLRSHHNHGSRCLQVYWLNLSDNATVGVNYNRMATILCVHIVV